MPTADKNWRDGRLFELMDGDVSVRIEQEAIHIKAVDVPYLDRVELTAEMAIQLANVLKEMAAQLD